MFDLLHLFIIADGFFGPAPHEAESAKAEAPTAEHVNLKKMEMVNPVEGFVDRTFTSRSVDGTIPTTLVTFPGQSFTFLLFLTLNKARFLTR